MEPVGQEGALVQGKLADGRSGLAHDGADGRVVVRDLLVRLGLRVAAAPATGRPALLERGACPVDELRAPLRLDLLLDLGVACAIMSVHWLFGSLARSIEPEAIALAYDSFATPAVVRV